MWLRLASRLSLPAGLSALFAVVRLLPRVNRSLTLLLLAGVIVASLLPLAVTVVTGLLIGTIPSAVREGLDSAAGRQALTVLAGAALLILAERLLGPVLATLAITFGRYVDRHLQERVMTAVARPSGIAHLEEPAVLDLIERAQGVGTQGRRPGDAVAALTSLLPSWLLALGSAAILTTFRPWLGLGWLVLWPVVLGYLQQEYLRVGQATYGQAAALRRADYYRDLALTPRTAKEVRIWGLPTWLVDRFDAAWSGAMAPIRQAHKPGRPVLWATTAVVVAANLISFGLLAAAAVRGEITLAALAVYTLAVINASGFRAFDDANTILAYAATSVPSLVELEQRLHEYPIRRGVSPRLESARTSIQFEGVTFRYPGQDVDVLTSLDLSIAAGRSLAIVGANGAGKTTIVKLLCRLYDPLSGHIIMDGTALDEVDPVAWRRHVAAIFQDFARYHLSARDNLALGATALADDFPLLREAARQAGALDLIEELPRGWDTVLSREYTDGVDLSGGEWQRIGLARALFAVQGGARILVLDEPTANLDVRAEAELYDRFLEITAGLTTILISHRFSTVRRADHIVVLADGRVIEEGNHDQLMAKDGQYATMFRLQAERFVEQVAEEEG